MRRTLAALSLVAAVAVGATACASEDETPPATTVDTLPSRDSTVPPPALGTTTTTVPQGVVPTDVDACSLLKELDVARVLGEDATEGVRLDTSAGDEVAGSTTTTTTTLVAGEDDPGARLFLSTCVWPDADDQQLRLTYVAPTVTGSALQHLERVVALEGRFAGDARAVPLNSVDGIPPAALISPDNELLQVAAADGAALVYVEPPDGVVAGSPEAQTILDLVIVAIERAPR